MTPPPGSRLPLDLDRLARVPDWRVEVLPAAASTNALVAERARAGEEEGLVLAAEHQTAGRGRLDRTWQTPARAALTFSVLLRPAVPVEAWPWLPLLTGLAVVEGIEAAGGPACALKWPNDVLHDGQKLAGILAERVETPTGAAAVVGIGLNVAQTRSELPVPTATSVDLAASRPTDRTELLVATLATLRRHYLRWLGNGGEAGDGQDGGLRQAYEARSDTLGRRVEVQLPDGRRLRGTAAGLDRHGGLVVSGPEGRIAVSAGDVVHVRS